MRINGIDGVPACESSIPFTDECKRPSVTRHTMTTQAAQDAQAAQAARDAQAAREARAERRRVAVETVAAEAAVRELRCVVGEWVACATAVYSEPDDSCPVCLAECTHTGTHPAEDTVETECCAAAMHRGCLAAYAASQFQTPHFAEAIDDAIAWRARGEAVHFGTLFHRLSEQGLFMPCPLCRATLLSEPPPVFASAASAAASAAGLQSPRRAVSAR